MTVIDAVKDALVGSTLQVRRLNSGVLIVEQINQDTSSPASQSTPRITGSPEPTTHESPVPIEETIVYGTKRNLPIQKTQTSISVVSNSDIEERVILDLEDALLRISNVSTFGNGTLRGVSIRGIGLGGVGGAGNGSTTNVYVDGAPLSNGTLLGSSNLWDMQQVEVLKGAQSTTQGRNALAGALTINSADPTYKSGLNLRVMAGNENQQQYSATLNIPVIDNQLALRVSADYREYDFEVNTVAGEPQMFEEALTARAKVLYEPTDNVRVLFGYQHTNTDSGDFNTVYAPGPFGTPEFEAFDPFGNETAASFGVFDYNVQSDRAVLDSTFSVNDVWKIYTLFTYEDAETSPNVLPLSTGTQSYDILTTELRAAFQTEAWRGWLGVYYYDEEFTNENTLTVPSSIFGIPTIPVDAAVLQSSFRQNRIENWALFADVSYDLSERWVINVGARYDRETFTDSGLSGTSVSDPASCVVDPIFPGLGGLPCSFLLPAPSAAPAPAEFNAFLPSLSIVFSPDENKSLSFSASRGYRAGGSTIVNQPGTAPTILEYDPEYLTNYELAARSEWPAQSTTLNANIFYSDWDDQQVRVPGLFGGAIQDSLILNAGSSRLYGAEIEVSRSFGDAVRLRASLGLLETEFRDFPFAVDEIGDPVNLSDPTYANLAGNNFDVAPNLTASLGIAYRGRSGFFASGDISYASDRFSDVTNLKDNEVDAYFLLNARIGYELKNWTISAFANNLLDERFENTRRVFDVQRSTGTVIPLGSPNFIVNYPRMMGLELRYSF